MDTHRGPLLTWAYYCQGKELQSMEELRQSLLYTSLELEQTRAACQKEKGSMQFRKKGGSKGEGSCYLTRLRTQITTVESCRSPSLVARRRRLLAVVGCSSSFDSVGLSISKSRFGNGGFGGKFSILGNKSA
ncbi:ras guanine nucleotide exchange factor K [Senna tora]|uniref:Ras guanine nucleotide exchange factor K n=1 Tax=Senna tora TaxID=362788 RepID=A0A835CM03_9FABA|nr:ras guanine nucleotide exchange factor K [Senna tora]